VDELKRKNRVMDQSRDEKKIHHRVRQFHLSKYSPKESSTNLFEDTKASTLEEDLKEGPVMIRMINNWR
jgi:hypothetical protein